MNEFALIERYFRALEIRRDDVILGIGDDAALLAPGTEATAVCTDTLVADVHFAADDDPADIGFKSLAVNLSDLAAMAAAPAWATLNLTLPNTDERWLEGFCQGFGELARCHRLSLVGGDTTRGPLTVSVQAAGTVPPGQALRRDGARPGHAVYLHAPVGDGALGLRVARGEYRPARADADYLLQRLRRPKPAVAAGLALRGLASAAIDVSDGLLADLGHVLAASGSRDSPLGARLVIDADAFSPAATHWLQAGGDPGILLGGGDDYVLCFTIDPRQAGTLQRQAEQAGFSPVCIGEVTDDGELVVEDGQGRALAVGAGGYRHFDDARGDGS